MDSAPAFALADIETFGQGVDHAEGICMTPDGTLYVGVALRPPAGG